MELLIRVVHRGDPNSPQSSRRGDVIACQPDGWHWSERELASPNWRIVSVSDCNMDLQSALLGSSLPADPVHYRRTSALDLDALDDHPEMQDALVVAEAARGGDELNSIGPDQEWIPLVTDGVPLFGRTTPKVSSDLVLTTRIIRV